MKRPYQKRLSGVTQQNLKSQESLTKEGQLLMPLLELLDRAEAALQGVTTEMGRGVVEAVLRMWVEAETEGEREDRKPRTAMGKGGQTGDTLDPGVEVGLLRQRIVALLMDGGAGQRARKGGRRGGDQGGADEASETARRIQRGDRLLGELAKQDFSNQDILIAYVDGIRAGEQDVSVAIGVDADGTKLLLDIRTGATESAAVAKALLRSLVSHGVQADRRRLFVIDGSKALRKAIVDIYGATALVQRCRNHRLSRILGHLPREHHDQAKATLRGAWKLGADQGKAKIEQYASWLGQEWPGAAETLLEGVDELFVVDRLGLPGALRRCLVTTNLIESKNSAAGPCRRSIDVTDAKTVLKWVAGRFAEGAESWRRIVGHEHLWILKAFLDEEVEEVQARAKKRGKNA